MVKRQRRFSKAAIARRGRQMYERQVRPRIAGEKKGRIVALDIETADFEVADDALHAAEQLRKRRPSARIWIERIGYPTLRRFGAWHATESAG
jgi:hypothetical protein